MRLNALDLVDYRLGRWQDAIGNTKADHLIIDAPYSDRTHDGGRAGTIDGIDRVPVAAHYDSWGQQQVEEVCDWAAANVRQWIVSMTDHALWSVWERALLARGYYVFAPVVLVETGRSVRLCGDGPACWSTFLCVARPRTHAAMAWRALPGAYTVPASRDKMMGGKPLAAMRSIVRDYSDPGDTIVDLCAGNATTLLAAAELGRRAIGCEMDPETWAKGKKRLTDRLHLPLLDRRPREQRNAELF